MTLLKTLADSWLVVDWGVALKGDDRGLLAGWDGAVEGEVKGLWTGFVAGEMLDGELAKTRARNFRDQSTARRKDYSLETCSSWHLQMVLPTGK